MQLSVLSDRERNPEVFQKIEKDAEAGSPIFNILTHRLRAGGKTVHITLRLWLAAISNGNPGRAVMWAWTATNMNLRGDTSDILMWAAAFPLGVPTDAEYLRVWDAQKGDGPSGNLLDRADVWAAVQVS